jgi:hypothetical protein|tara:strand:+ start:275 stop:469 length:195 start_codon:yes stop_codon:yes gene_type:complete
MENLKGLIALLGGILIIYAVADFGLSFAGYNLTPFLPDGISRFSPIIIGAIGGLLVKMSGANTK